MGESHGLKCLSSALRLTVIEVLFRPRIISFDKLLVVCNAINSWWLLVGWGLPHRDDVGSLVRWAKAYPTKLQAIPKLVPIFRDLLEAATHKIRCYRILRTGK